MIKCRQCENIIDTEYQFKLKPLPFDWKFKYCSKQCWKISKYYNKYKKNFLNIYYKLNKNERNFFINILVEPDNGYFAEILKWIE